VNSRSWDAEGQAGLRWPADGPPHQADRFPGWVIQVADVEAGARLRLIRLDQSGTNRLGNSRGVEAAGPATQSLSVGDGSIAGAGLAAAPGVQPSRTIGWCLTDRPDQPSAGRRISSSARAAHRRGGWAHLALHRQEPGCGGDGRFEGCGDRG